QELQMWLRCLQQADLMPQVVDITPCALLAMADAAGLPADAVLLHRLDDHWLWAAPRSAAFACGVLREPEAEDAGRALAAVRAANGDAQVVYYSSVLD